MDFSIKTFAQSVLPWLTSHGLKILVILLFSFVAYAILKRVIARGVRISIIKDSSSSVMAQKKREDTLSRIFGGVLKIVIIAIALMMVLQELGIEIAPILAGAGIVGVAIGFGGQYLIRDVISGFFIILENQYRIGDVVDFDGTGGLVEDISLRMTTIRDLDGTVHHIPHGEIKRVSNLSKFFSRVNINVGVSYNSNLEHVIAVINRVGQEMALDPIWKDAIIKPPQFLRVDEFADSSINVKILGDTQPIRQWEVAGELRRRLKIEFDKEGIEIPFPQRVVHHIKE